MSARPPARERGEAFIERLRARHVTASPCFRSVASPGGAVDHLLPDLRRRLRELLFEDPEVGPEQDEQVDADAAVTVAFRRSPVRIAASPKKSACAEARLQGVSRPS